MRGDNKEISSMAIRHFIDHMIGSLESGFVDSNTLNLSQLHRVAQNYLLDNYGVEMPHIIEEWGEEISFLCGYNGKLQENEN